MSLYAFFGPTPPSISIQGSTPLALHISFSSLTLSTCDSMKLWPPKPGFTDMMSTRSTSSRTYSICDRGVPGFRTTPAMQPKLLIMFTTRCKWIVDADSQCTEMMSAPAFAKSSTRCSGSTIMRWQSSSASGSFLRSASTTRGPIVMLGTKRPSITSTWTQSAPALSTSSTSWPSFEKSAERIEGEICTVFSFMARSFSTRGFSARKATARARERTPAPFTPRRRRAVRAANPTPTTPATNGKAPHDGIVAVSAAWGAVRPLAATCEARRCGAGEATKAAAPVKAAGRRTDFNAIVEGGPQAE
mmetsp:Transcript_27073/g.77681  ORF Transcript_27073/g.77681 Transcript_27073/m.77681 type:complete len:303 (-) Transcript_27073:69-977(-)